MSKNADELFPGIGGDLPLDVQVQVIQNRLRKGIALQEWELAVLKAAGKSGTVPILNAQAQAVFERTYAKPEPQGYHLAIIPQGEYGEVSKVIEEIHEAMDAYNQGNTVMCLVELSDVVLAMEGVTLKYRNAKLDTIFLPEEITDKKQATWIEVCEKFAFVLRNTQLHPEYMIAKFSYILEVVDRYLRNYNMQLGHLYIMAQATARAFESGQRKKKDNGKERTAAGEHRSSTAAA